MKKAFLAILLASAMAAPMFAQGGPANPPDPTKFIARRVQHLTTLLDLTTAQQGTATTAFTGAASANAQVETQLRTARQNLRADIEGTGGNGIAADTTTIANLGAQILANDATAEQTLWNALQPAQQAKLKALGPGGMGMGPGPGGPRGFDGPR
jgi:Spy/CpxP family protein refolding chaperone